MANNTLLQQVGIVFRQTDEKPNQPTLPTTWPVFKERVQV